MKKELTCLGLVGAAVAVASCGSPVTTSQQIAPAGNTGTALSTGTVNNAAGFAISVSSTATATMHQAAISYGTPGLDTSNFSAPCRIMPGAVGNTNVDILCYAEVAELDLYFQQLNVVYNVPQNMCTYLKVTPYSFWVMEPGTGPTTVSHTVNPDGSITNGANYQNGAPYCQYDYTPGNGPNCCNGAYNDITTTLTTETQTTYMTSTTTSTTTSAGVTSTATSTNTQTNYTTATTTGVNSTVASWTGEPGNCLSGPATKSQHLTTQGYPETTIYYVAAAGLNSTYTVPAAISETFNSNQIGSDLWAANYYDPGQHTYTGTATITTTITTTATSTQTNTYTSLGYVPDPFTMKSRPTALRVPNNLSYYAYLPSDSYEFGCYDQAEELQYRIRLMVRKWNVEPITENCTTNCPDTGYGQYESAPDPTLPLDSRLDWHDLQARYPGLGNI